MANNFKVNRNLTNQDFNKFSRQHYFCLVTNRENTVPSVFDKYNTFLKNKNYPELDIKDINVFYGRQVNNFLGTSNIPDNLVFIAFSTDKFTPEQSKHLAQNSQDCTFSSLSKYYSHY